MSQLDTTETCEAITSLRKEIKAFSTDLAITGARSPTEYQREQASRLRLTMSAGPYYDLLVEDISETEFIQRDSTCLTRTERKQKDAWKVLDDLLSEIAEGNIIPRSPCNIGKELLSLFGRVADAYGVDIDPALQAKAEEESTGDKPEPPAVSDKSKPKRGRKRLSGQSEKRGNQAVDAWKTCHYKTYASCAESLGCDYTENEVRRAVDRERARANRPRE